MSTPFDLEEEEEQGGLGTSEVFHDSNVVELDVPENRPGNPSLTPPPQPDLATSSNTTVPPVLRIKKRKAKNTPSVIKFEQVDGEDKDKEKKRFEEAREILYCFLWFFLAATLVGAGLFAQKHFKFEWSLK